MNVADVLVGNSTEHALGAYPFFPLGSRYRSGAGLVSRSAERGVATLRYVKVRHLTGTTAVLEATLQQMPKALPRAASRLRVRIGASSPVKLRVQHTREAGGI